MASLDILPPLPTDTASFLGHITANNGDKPLRELVQPYLEYENKLRSLFAQDPSNATLADNTVGLVPIYAGEEASIKIQARVPRNEQDKSRYLMELDKLTRKKTGERAIVDFEDFQRNFSIFTEGALQNLDWTNIVAAGSSILTPILTVPKAHAKNKRTLRNYYHQVFAPTSDIDLFIYGTQDEKVAIQRMEAIEATIYSNLLWEASSVRTKNTITIISQYPNRHIQIVLRLYSSISEILTGFDVNCACVAYDGQQVYASPRAIVSWMLQCNDIDLTRRSPSYEFRLAKYRKRGFEVYYPDLQRNKIDPTIYDRNIVKLRGLAKLLLLERLPDAHDRDAHLVSRRSEQGRPTRSGRGSRYRRSRKGRELQALKTRVPEIPEWEVNIVTTDEALEESNYYTITLPYGEEYPAKRTERLIYQSDMFLNTKNTTQKKAIVQKDRVGYLHRHPAFVGTVKYIVGDCCENCPEPQNDEEKELQAQDDKYFVRGPISFIRDDPGRQEIGSFNPQTKDDWTQMAYLTDNEIFFRAIASNDVEAIKEWISTRRSSSSMPNSEENDINKRDHTGRNALHLAVTTSIPEVVKLLLDSGVKLTRRVANGRTALHIAAARGDPEIVKLLLLKSQENEELQSQREDQKRSREQGSQAPKDKGESAADEEEADGELIDDGDAESILFNRAPVSVRTGVSSYVGVRKKSEDPESADASGGEQEVDVEDNGDILDINAPDWDFKMSPLHYAIVHNHPGIVRLLVSDFGADVLQPVKTTPPILTIPLATAISKKEERENMIRTLLKAGASSSQLDTNNISAFMHILEQRDTDALKILFEEDAASALTVAKNFTVGTGQYPAIKYSLFTAIEQKDEAGALFLLEKGVPPQLTLNMILSKLTKYDPQTQKNIRRFYKANFRQPAELALDEKLFKVFMKCIECGVGPSSYTAGGYPAEEGDEDDQSNNWTRKQGLTLLDKLHTMVASSDHESAQPYQQQFGFQNQPRNLRKAKGTIRELVSLPKNYAEGSYEFWLASQLINAENTKRETENEKIRKDNAEISDTAGNKEPEENIEAPKNHYRELADWLVSKGGKAYKEEFLNFTYGYGNKAKTNNAYHELFKAVWNGDVDALKKYTSPSVEKIEGAEEKVEDELPLLVATSNQLNYSLFSIAVYRKHPAEFLDLLLRIAFSQCQLITKNNESNNDDSDDDSGDDSDGLIIGRQSQALTTITPADIIRQSVAAVFDGYPALADQAPLLMQAAVTGCNDIFDYLTSRLEKLDNTPIFDTRISPGWNNEITVSIHNQHLGILSTILQINGFGAFPGQHKIILNNPDVYTGLSINGKKQNGWGNPVEEKKEHRNIVPSSEPAALLAAYYGSHKVYEWLESDGAKIALARYQKLQEEPDGPKADAGIPTFQGWLGIDHPLLLHAIILNLSPASDANLSEDEKLAWYEHNIKYFLSRQPSLLESKENNSGLTPLLLAGRCFNKYALRVLMKLEANLYAVVPVTNVNLVHLITNEEYRKSRNDIAEMLGFLPRDFKRWAFSQRALYNDVEYTALAYRLSQGKEMVYDSEAQISANIIPLLLEHSDHADLGTRTTLGDLPIHIAVKQSRVDSLQCILDVSTPRDLFAENANGVTVLELAWATWYQNMLHRSPMPKHMTTVPKPSQPKIEKEIELKKKQDALTINIRNEEWGIDENDAREVQVLKMVEVAIKKALIAGGGSSRGLVSAREANEKQNKKRPMMARAEPDTLERLTIAREEPVSTRALNSS
ncbi:hypothetical protein TWF106_003953 [Orbilia oligospora]|uniref:Ankyrin repeat protein n=1 Tax=Orbilia oligospora TaxID=2813651 RepID=A0A7C8Q7Z7_ORBOL|nr:hypothetical protein TWF106_003953 [Orbilia oligospora]